MLVGCREVALTGFLRPREVLDRAGYHRGYRLLVEEVSGKVRFLTRDAVLTLPDPAIRAIHLVSVCGLAAGS